MQMARRFSENVISEYPLNTMMPLETGYAWKKNASPSY
jgi:hypothetical protein